MTREGMLILDKLDTWYKLGVSSDILLERLQAFDQNIFNPTPEA